MRMSDFDIRIEKNFLLSEALFWAHLLNMSDQDKQKASELAIESLNYETMASICYQAGILQGLRGALNKEFRGNNIRLRVTSWLRALEWEMYRGRSGTSYHVKGMATDFQIVGLPSNLSEDGYEFALLYLRDVGGFSKRYRWGVHHDHRGLL